MLSVGFGWVLVCQVGVLCVLVYAYAVWIFVCMCVCFLSAYACVSDVGVCLF